MVQESILHNHNIKVTWLREVGTTTKCEQGITALYIMLYMYNDIIVNSTGPNELYIQSTCIANLVVSKHHLLFHVDWYSLFIVGIINSWIKSVEGRAVLRFAKHGNWVAVHTFLIQRVPWLSKYIAWKLLHTHGSISERLGFEWC